MTAFIVITALGATAPDSRASLELETEIARVEDSRPSAAWYVPAVALIPLGTAGLVAAALTGVHLSFSFGGGDSSYYRLSAGGVVGVFAGVGALITGISGIVWLAVTRAAPNRRLRELEHEREVQSEARFDERVRARLHALKDERLGLGLPVTMIIGGAGLAVAGVAQYALWNPNYRNVGSLTVAIIAGVVGALSTGVGLWQFVSRHNRRLEIDEELEQLQSSAPPIESRLPSAPTFLSFAVPL
jgi:hypothetical protein